MITGLGRSKLRSKVVALALAVMLSAAGAVTFASTEAAAAAGVENEGADCVVTGLPDAGSLPTNSRLPDPFTRLNGTRITTRSDWRCRREEIKRLAERFVYGEKPPKPASVTGTVSRTGITVNVNHNGRSASFSASVSLPSGSGPFPAVVVLGGFGADAAAIRAAGAAVISYDPYAVGREGTPRNNKQGAFYSIYGSSSSTGLLLAWGWGVSRIIDVIEQSDGSILRADATGVTGCSRFGKGAFVTGAFDQRIALTMPIESGSAGVPIFRGIPGEGAQSLSSAYGEQPWLGDAFGSFTGSPGRLPVDTHEMVAMVAPRGLFIMDNPHITNLGPRSAIVAALGGAEVYKALGAGDNITYWSDVQDGTHCASRSEWRTPLQQNIQKHLLKTGNAAGAMRISSRASGNLAEWRDWQTPALGDGGGDTTAPSTPGTPAATGVTATSATLTWPASTDQGGSGLAGYNVYREQGATDPQLGQSATNSITLTGLTANTQYQVYVRARDGAGNLSGNSPAVTFTTTTGGGDTSPPTAPAGLAASGTTSTGTSLSWTASTDDNGVTGYDILRAPGASGGTFTQAGTSATTSFNDTGLTPSTTYRYQVRARDAAGNTSPVSNTVSVTTAPGTSTGACTAAATVQTQWATGYVVQPLTITNTGTATITGWTVTFTLPAGHTLTGSWNATTTVSGQTVTIRNVGHNGTLAPGAATTSVGFQVSRPNGNTALPSGYTCA
ncbi:fibronectin type III domain-containing protein [Nonomuraea jiangxiensis]|uniref:Chitodextrinase n=1 Tax=Nonomuraea jiangxiensis TaxID=633440 RepID=A0A1G9B6H0_9ACTN|nr:fibronectin type III domain-containing protein [Nonomuraea jiangxiensis]SDK34684.1 Chitodextrinase [Nonomuraea jiangxiensis]